MGCFDEYDGDSTPPPVYAKLDQRAVTFDRWVKCLRNLRTDSIEYKTAFDNMIELAQTFKEWKIIYAKTDMHTQREILDLAAGKMAELASNFGEAWLVYHLTPHNSEFENIAKEKIQGFAVTQEEKEKAKKIQ